MLAKLCRCEIRAYHWRVAEDSKPSGVLSRVDVSGVVSLKRRKVLVNQ